MINCGFRCVLFSRINLFISFGILFYLCFWSAALASPAKKDDAKVSVLIATGMPGGTYYQIGLGMASLWTTSLRDQGIRVSAAISEGSLENIEAIRIADADLILVESFLGSMAFNGRGTYKANPVKELRSITNLWPDVLHVLIRSDRVETGTLRDLEGLNVAVELPDSGSRLLTEALLRTLKMGKRKIRLRPMTHTQAAENLKKGAVQALIMNGGIPIPVIANLVMDPKTFSFLDIADSQIRVVHREFGDRVVHYVIPASTYAGLEKPVNTVGQMNMLAVTASLDDKIVYELTRTLYENLDYMARVHPACRSIRLEKALEGLDVPLHRGAVRYYMEKKINVPEHLIN